MAGAAARRVALAAVSRPLRAGRASRVAKRCCTSSEAPRPDVYSKAAVLPAASPWRQDAGVAQLGSKSSFDSAPAALVVDHCPMGFVGHAQQPAFDLAFSPALIAPGGGPFGPAALFSHHSNSRQKELDRSSAGLPWPLKGLTGATASPNALVVGHNWEMTQEAQSEVLPRFPSLHQGFGGSVVPPAAVVLGNMGGLGDSMPPHMDYWHKYESNMGTYR